MVCLYIIFFFFQAEGGIRVLTVTGVQTCALPISERLAPWSSSDRAPWKASTSESSPSPSDWWTPGPRPPRRRRDLVATLDSCRGNAHRLRSRSEEHTSELQSQSNLVCRLLLEKKK